MSLAAVTGAASGIGAATARLLAARGLDVALLDLRADAAREVAREIGAGAYAVELDVTSPASVAAAFAGVHELSALVNAAGLVVVDAFESFGDEDWRLTHEVNVLGTYRCMPGGRVPSRRGHDRGRRPGPSGRRRGLMAVGVADH